MAVETIYRKDSSSTGENTGRPCIRPDYDVIVLGAGPAGAAAALALAQKGLSVAALDRARTNTLRFGETLPPTVMKPLVRLGVWESFLRAGHAAAPGTVAIWGDARPYENDFVFNPYGVGWHLDRLQFDAMLVGAARLAGAKVYSNVSSVKCVYGTSRTWTVLLAGPTGVCTLTARWAIDATGRAGWLARRQGFGRRSIDHLVALIRFGRPSPSADPRTFIEACQDGWWYAAALPQKRAVAAFFTDADLVPRDSRQRAQWWNQLLRSTQLVSSLMLPSDCASVLYAAAADSASLMRCAGENWLAVGDAAQSYDPLSGQGITMALLSALAASEAISTYESGDRGAFDSFADMANVEFHKYRTRRLAYYQREQRWRDSLFWQRRHPIR
jgi:flavin-dependent dehydrogenase